MSMEIGKIVAFFEQKRILCAVCLEVKENRVHLLSEENREITLGANRIVHTSTSSFKTQLPRESLVENLKKIVEKQKTLTQAVALHGAMGGSVRRREGVHPAGTDRIRFPPRSFQRPRDGGSAGSF